MISTGGGQPVGDRGRGLVAVVGSANVDLVVPVARLPAAGETVLGDDYRRYPGGKGANQAVAAARLGADVALIGRIGDDDLAATVLTAVAQAGVDASRLRRTAGTPTGLAMITVAPDGENTITVSPGANHKLTSDDMAAEREVLAAARVVLLQLEIPLGTVLAAATYSSGTVILNPAPAAELPTGLLAQVDILVPNRSELGALAGAAEPATPEQAAELVARIPAPVPGTVVVTLGAQGALVVQDGQPTHVPAVPVEVVDATGAGDVFCGALAAALARGRDVLAAAHWAVRAAAISTTRLGAQTATPTHTEVGPPPC